MSKLLKVGHLGAEKVKFKFNITIHDLTLFELGFKEAKVDPKSTENTFSITWKRGSDKTGKTEFEEIKNSKLTWDSLQVVTGTLYKEKKGGYQKKLISFQLEVKDKKGKVKILGKGETNLSQFTDDSVEQSKHGDQQVVLKIGGSIKKKPSNLRISVTSENINSAKEGDEDFSEMTENKTHYDGGSDDEEETKTSSRDSWSGTSTKQTLENLNKIQELQNKVRQLQAIIDSDDKDDQKSSMMSKLNEELDEYKEKNSRLEKELEPLKKEVERLNTVSKSSSDKSFELQIKYQKEIQELEKENKKLMEQNDKFANSSINDEEKKNFEKEISQLTTSVENLKSKNQKILDDHKNLEEKFSSLKKEKEKNENLEKEKHSKLQKERDELDSERFKLKEQLSSSQSQLKLFQNQTDDVSKEIITKLELEKKELFNSKESLQNEMNQIQKENKKIKEDFDEINEENNQLNQENQQLNETLNNLKEKKEKYTKDENLRYDTLMVEKDHAESEVFRLKNELKKSEEENRSLKTQMLTSSSSSNSILKKKDQDSVVIKNLKNEIEILSNQNSELKKEMDKIRDEKERMKKENEKIKLTIENLENENLNLLDKQDELVYSLKEKTSKVEELKIFENSFDELQVEKYQNEKLKSEMKKYELVKIEKYIIENSILFFESKFEDEIPINLKIIYLTILEWNVFEKRKVFCLNMLNSLDFILQNSNTEKSIHWLNILYRLVNLFHKEEEKKTQNIFSVLQKKDGLEIPKDSSEETVLQDMIENEDEKSDEMFEIFFKKINELLMRTILQLINRELSPIIEILDDLFFEIKKTPNSHTGLTSYHEAQINFILEKLNGIYNQFQLQFIHKKVINYFFESILINLDEYCFNTFITDASLSIKGIQMKMLLSSIEQWFEEKGIKTSTKYFSHSRQACDVCVIAHKSLLTDEQMREMMCPSLSLPQIAQLLGNFFKLSKDKSDASFIEEFKKGKGSEDMILKSKYYFFKFFDVESKKIEDHYLFDFDDLNQNKSKLEYISSPKKFLLNKNFEFLH
eukprot:gene807-9057_t